MSAESAGGEGVGRFGRAIFEEVAAERERAHSKHGDTSMESEPWWSHRRYTILAEEVGEVAKEFNEGHHRGERPDPALLRKELIQVAAMAAAWAAVLPAADTDPPRAGAAGTLRQAVEALVVDYESIARWNTEAWKRYANVAADLRRVLDDTKDQP